MNLLELKEGSSLSLCSGLRGALLVGSVFRLSMCLRASNRPTSITLESFESAIIQRASGVAWHAPSASNLASSDTLKIEGGTSCHNRRITISSAWMNAARRATTIVWSQGDTGSSTDTKLL